MAALVSQAFRSSRRLRFGWPVASCRRDCSQQAWNVESGDMFVQATYAARAVSLPDLVQHVRSKWKHGTYSHRMDRDWVFFDIDHDSYYSHHTRVEALPGMPAMLGVSRRGSVVRVNADGNSVDHDLEAALWHATTVPLPSGQRRVSEELRLVVDPEKASPCFIHRGALHVHTLDTDALRIISSCMAQTVNLAFFEAQVDSLHEVVGEVNAALDKEVDLASGGWLRGVLFGTQQHVMGSLKVSSAGLYRRLGDVSAISNQIMLSGLRSTVRPGSTAWKEEQYATLHDELAEELDLSQRYQELTRKLEYVAESIKYALETKKGQTSLYLERLIVGLVAAELILSCLNAGLHTRLLAFLMASAG